jgi:hypothetical protein
MDHGWMGELRSPEANHNTGLDPPESVLDYIPFTDGVDMRKLLRKSIVVCFALLILLMCIACHPKNERVITIPEGGTWSTSWIDTGIQIRKGQTVMIDATGSVQPSSASDISAGPDGTGEVQIWQDSYSFNPVFPHEAVIARVGGGDILLIGSGQQFEAQNAGILEIGVNDTDPGNNVGSFTVEINW